MRERVVGGVCGWKKRCPPSPSRRRRVCPQCARPAPPRAILASLNPPTAPAGGAGDRARARGVWAEAGGAGGVVPPCSLSLLERQRQRRSRPRQKRDKRGPPRPGAGLPPHRRAGLPSGSDPAPAGGQCAGARPLQPPSQRRGQGADTTHRAGGGQASPPRPSLSLASKKTHRPPRPGPAPPGAGPAGWGGRWGLQGRAALLLLLLCLCARARVREGAGETKKKYERARSSPNTAPRF